jgi:hypothetical protein
MVFSIRPISRKPVASSFGYSLALSIVNNFESDRSLILGANLNPNKWVNPKIWSV